jgi:predicted dehydrogenase
MAIRILHVGAGDRGRNWLGYVARFAATESVGVVEPVASALEKAKSQGHGSVPAFSDLGEALKACEADAALIASPSGLHARQALEALDAGLHVMIEKPFAPDVAAAREVIERGEKVGKTVMVAENFRYVPVERTIRKAMQDGLVGNVSNVSFTDRRRMGTDMQGAWVKDIELPQLSEIAIHHFDSMRSFFGRAPTSVSAHVWNPPSSDYAAGACTQATIVMEDDLVVEYLGTLTSNKFSYRIWIEGDQGDLWTNRKWILWRQRGKKFFKPLKKEKVLEGDGDPYPREGTTSLLESLRAAVEDGREPETSGRENVWAVAMREAAFVSVRERRAVPITEVYSPGT